jgi:hypothetical protein
MYNGAARLTEQPKVDLWIYRGEFRDHLAYRVEMPRLDGTEHTSVPVIFVDAQTGEKVFEYNNLQTGSGNSLYSGTVTVDTSVSGSTYYMEDLTRKMGTFNMNNTGNTTTGTGGTQSRYTGTDDIWSATAERAGLTLITARRKLSITSKTFTDATASTAAADRELQQRQPTARSV